MLSLPPLIPVEPDDLLKDIVTLTAGAAVAINMPMTVHAVIICVGVI